MPHYGNVFFSFRLKTAGIEKPRAESYIREGHRHDQSNLWELQ